MMMALCMFAVFLVIKFIFCKNNDYTTYMVFSILTAVGGGRVERSSGGQVSSNAMTKPYLLRVASQLNSMT